MANSNSFLRRSLWNSFGSSRKQIFRERFLSYHKIVCCLYLLESPHQDDSSEHTQPKLFCSKIEKEKSLNFRYLLPDLAPWLILSGSNYKVAMSRTIFCGPKDIRAIVVRLHNKFCKQTHLRKQKKKKKKKKKKKNTNVHLKQYVR